MPCSKIGRGGNQRKPEGTIKQNPTDLLYLRYRDPVYLAKRRAHLEKILAPQSWNKKAEAVLKTVGRSRKVSKGQRAFLKQMAAARYEPTPRQLQYLEDIDTQVWWRGLS